MNRRCFATGKVRYPNERAAQVALVDAILKRNRGRSDRREARHYPCGICGGWHLTSKTVNHYREATA